MKYFVVSFSYKNVDISLREKLSLSMDSINTLTKYLLDSKIVNEVILLSTCNRVELIAMSNEIYDAMQLFFIKLGDLSSLKKDELEGRANTFEGYSAIHHIFLVASGLDSLVIGETQISGQLRDSYKYSINNNYCTNVGLGRVMDFAFRCASNVRNKTQISSRPVSIASVAVSSLSNINISLKKALVIGLGEMGQIVSKHLLNSNYEVCLINRNFDKAIEFKNDINNNNLLIGKFSDLKELVNKYEVIFSATSASGFIITKDMITNTSFKRYFFDLAVPRDIDSDIMSMCDCNIVVIDDLQNIANTNFIRRKNDLNLAYEIVGNEVNEFFKWLNIHSVEPIIKSLREIAKNASLNEINKAIKKGYLPESCRDNIEKTVHNIFNIFLHNPTKKIKELSSSSHIVDIERVLKLLFNIDNNAIS